MAYRLVTNLMTYSVTSNLRVSVTTHNSRTYRCRIFKLNEGVDHVTRHEWLLTKVKD